MLSSLLLHLCPSYVRTHCPEIAHPSILQALFAVIPLDYTSYLPVRPRYRRGANQSEGRQLIEQMDTVVPVCAFVNYLVPFPTPRDLNDRLAGHLGLAAVALDGPRLVHSWRPWEVALIETLQANAVGWTPLQKTSHLGRRQNVWREPPRRIALLAFTLRQTARSVFGGMRQKAK